MIGDDNPSRLYLVTGLDRTRLAARYLETTGARIHTGTHSIHIPHRAAAMVHPGRHTRLRPGAGEGAVPLVISRRHRVQLVAGLAADLASRAHVLGRTDHS